MKKFLITMFYTALAAVLLWGFLSYAEIVVKNLSDNPTYSDYNLIVVMTDALNE